MGGRLLSLDERQLCLVNKSMEEFGEGRLVKDNGVFNVEAPIILVDSGSHSLANRDVLKFYPSGVIYRIGFFTGMGQFIHASQSKKYFDNLQMKYGKTPVLQQTGQEESDNFLEEFEQLFS